MDKGGQRQTASATEFASLTGVSRERLRTWERRHGFPEPVRAGSGARRYAVDDVPRVVAVRRAVDAGVPVEDAIGATGLLTEAGISDGARGALAEHAPVAVVAISGPEPLRIEWVNAVVRRRPGAPAPGEDIEARAPWFADHAGAQTLRRLFVEDLVAASCEHPDWMAQMEPGAHSLAFRLPQEPGQRPLVALVGVDTGRERRTRQMLTAAEQERDALRASLDHDRRFADAAAAVADLFRLQGGHGALAEAAGLLVRRLGTVDAAITSYMTGAVVLGRSARGLLGPEMVTVSRFDELADAIRDGETTWLSGPACAAFGAPDGLALLAVPVLVGGETLGALLLLFDSEQPLDDTARRLLRVISATLGFALARQRDAEHLDATG